MMTIDLQSTIVGLAVLSALTAAAAIAVPILNRQAHLSRFKSIMNRRQELSRKQTESLAGKGSAIRQRKQATRTETMKKVLRGLKLDRALSSRDARAHLAQAGYRSQHALISYIFSRVVFAALGFSLSFIVLSFWLDLAYPFAANLAVMIGGAVAGFLLPGVYISNAAQKRQQELNEGFADALDLMVICVEGGLSVEAAFERVTVELAETAPTLSQEFGLTAAELAYLGDRHQAYVNFAERTGLATIKSLTTTLLQSEKYGTPVGRALKVLGKERRAERMAKAEKKGASLPAKLTVPMILFFLPPLFMVVIGPAVIQIMNM